MEHDGRYPTIKAIEQWDIRNGDLARIANVSQPRVSDYTSGKPVTDLLRDRIEEAVRKIALVRSTFRSVKIDISDPVSFENAVKLAEFVRAKLAEQEAQEQAEMLDALPDFPCVIAD